MMVNVTYLPSITKAQENIEEANAYLLGIRYSTERVKKVMDCHREAVVLLMRFINSPSDHRHV